MPEYQVTARKYRPQRFSEVLAQDAIVTTLKNAIKHERLAHAYLFCGSRGTGKTTLARVFAKALNCENRTADLEPCGNCTSCREIASGSSLDVIEIDGASHRGIDDMREINDNVGYTSSSGKKKIYIIDEVHMLTKEAFNALLKTLEEPPASVMFFFATTEPHKVLATILSRCQRFNLNRIPQETILQKLQKICDDQGVKAEPTALQLVAKRAEGGLRDAESLLDQVLSFHEGDLTLKAASNSLGVMESDCFFEIDEAQKNGDLKVAFKISHELFSQGKDLNHFIEGLLEHFRNLVLVHLTGTSPNAGQELPRYLQSAKLYSKEQCLEILEYLIDKQQEVRFSPSPRIALEGILLKVLRSRHRLNVESLVAKLIELESKISLHQEKPQHVSPVIVESSTQVEPIVAKAPLEQKPIQPVAPPLAQPIPRQEKALELMIDPEPTEADLGLKKEKKKPEAKAEVKPEVKPAITSAEVSHQPIKIDNPNRLDTLLQFASVELEGSIQKRQLR